MLGAESPGIMLGGSPIMMIDTLLRTRANAGKRVNKAERLQEGKATTLKKVDRIKTLIR